MEEKPIISQVEALQILRNDLRRAALEQRAAEFQDATPERRKKILAEIDGKIQQEINRRAKPNWQHLLD